MLSNSVGGLYVMVIVETSIFTRQLQGELTDEEYRQLQLLLVNRPDAGTIIVGSGGLRKVRWGKQSKGKRGGVRVIYYWAVGQEQLLMLLIYPKSERDDLTAAQLKVLRQIVEEEYL
jgi:mRNA-degrading endonuclease RelE of RelBE toxin-antitoxin system